MTTEICSICKKAIIPGQARHGARKCHWDCYKKENPESEANFKEAKKMIEDLDKAFADLMQTVKDRR